MKIISRAFALFFRKKVPKEDNPPQIRFFDVYYSHPLVVGFDVVSKQNDDIVGFYVSES